MHRVASLDDADDFLGVAVDQRHFAGITEGDREQVLEVQLVHLLLGTLIDRNHHLPGVHRVLEAVLGRDVRRVLDVLRHQADLILGQDVVEVHHAAVGAVADDLFQTGLAELERAALGNVAVLVLLGPVRLEVLAGSPLAQHPVTAGAALEVDLLGLFFFGSAQFRRLGGILSESGTHGRGHGSHCKHPQYGFSHLPLLEQNKARHFPSAMGARLNLSRWGGIDPDQAFIA